MTLPLNAEHLARAYQAMKRNDEPVNRLEEWQAAAQVVANMLKAALPATEDYDVTRADLVSRLFDAFIGFVSQSGSVTSWRNDARKALVEDVPSAFYRGYEDAAEADAETEDDDEKWLTGKLNEQLSFMGDAFEALKEWRMAENFTEADVQAKAETWAQTLDSIYSEGVLRGKKSQLLEWQFGDTDHCDTCAKLDGQKHKASWYLDRDYIPGKPGAAMECHGYRCQCVLLDKDGNEVTL